MGKSDDEPPLSSLPPPPDAETDGNAAPRCRPIQKIVRVRCIAMLLLGAAVLLSAVFCLPPFLQGDGRGRHRDLHYRADIMASFRLQKPVSQLNTNITQLQYDIYGEIGVPDSRVGVMFLEPLTGLNMTNVVFGIWPFPKDSNISSAGLSILRSSFVSLVEQQSTLHLTTSLFGDSSFFQVLKFPGGISITPPQIAFPLQKPHLLFNFTLIFSIYQVQYKIGELKEQMKLGLLLNPYENLYVTLTNINGSTISPPTVVQTSIVLAIGNHLPSAPRLKQLAQNIKNSSEGNLGLNHTVFGRVKQIRLSSYLRHSLSSGGSSTSFSPTPAPHPYPKHHRHHHHHRHQQDSYMHTAPAPAPRQSYQGAPPSGCGTVVSTRPKTITPGAAPVPSLHHLSPAAAPAPSLHHASASPPNEDPPVSPKPTHFESPLPAVVYAHAPPPSERVIDFKPPDGAPSISPTQFSASVADWPSVYWILFLPLYLLMHQ